MTMSPLLVSNMTAMLVVDTRWQTEQRYNADLVRLSALTDQG